MDILILSLIFVSLSLGAYRLKKHTDKVRKEMIEEMEEMEAIEELHSHKNYFPDWEDQEADVNDKK